MMLARPYRVEAELFGQDRLFEEVAVDLVHRPRAARQVANSHADDELHAASPIAPIPVRHGNPMSSFGRSSEKLAREAEQLELALEALETDQAERLVTASPAVVAVVETRPKCRTGTAPLPE